MERIWYGPRLQHGQPKRLVWLVYVITVFNYFPDEIQCVPGRLRDTDSVFKGETAGYKYIMGTFAAGPECDDELPGSVVDLMRGFVVWKHYNTNLNGLRND